VVVPTGAYQFPTFNNPLTHLLAGREIDHFYGIALYPRLVERGVFGHQKYPILLQVLPDAAITAIGCGKFNIIDPLIIRI
jgi:hypothetical protein